MALQGDGYEGDKQEFYGQEGPIQRLLYTGRHYDLLLPKEAWTREWEQEAKERQGPAQHAAPLQPAQSHQERHREIMWNAHTSTRGSAKEMTSRDKGIARRRDAQHKDQQGRHERWLTPHEKQGTVERNTPHPSCRRKMLWN